MHRSSPSWVRRLNAACLAVWFVAMSMDALAMHACPMHDPFAAASMPMGMTHDMAGDGMPESTHDTAHKCLCVAQCCVTKLPFAAACPVSALSVVLASAPQATGRPAYEYVAAWVDFILPFATAPPVRAHV